MKPRGRRCGLVTVCGMALMAATVVTGEDKATVERDRFLLLDSRIIASTENAKLVVGTIKKHKANPLFVEDKPWEKRYDNLYGNVIYDKQDKLYKCWYSPFTVDHSSKGMTLKQRQKRYRPPRGREMSICYATSKDGITWEKPNLGLIEYKGNKNNNIVWRKPHGAGVFKDDRDPDPKRRYKTIFQGVMTSTSPDGLNWAPAKKIKNIHVHADTHNHVFWAPTLEKYVGITRTWGKMDGRRTREVAWTSTTDYETWSPIEIVMKGSNNRQQPYAMPIFYHGGVYLGLVCIHDQPPVDRVWVELAWSSDTKEWHRVSEGTPLIPCSEKMLEYDYGCVYACANPIFLKDEIRLYYGASDYLHYGWRNGSLALATLRPDGFAGFEQEAKDKPAVVTTTAIPSNGKPLKITADVDRGGVVQASVVDADGKVIAAGKRIRKTVTDARLVFKGRLPKGDIRLRITFKKAKVYSISF